MRPDTRARHDALHEAADLLDQADNHADTALVLYDLAVELRRRAAETVLGQR